MPDTPPPSAAENATGFQVEFALYGGAQDGAVLAMELKPKGEGYLIRRERSGQKGVWDVWSYEWADRTDRKGRWVLAHRCYVGHQGMPHETGGEG